MTRNRELDLEDLTACTHEPEVAVSNERGGVDYWICRCGRRVPDRPERRPYTRPSIVESVEFEALATDAEVEPMGSDQ